MHMHGFSVRSQSTLPAASLAWERTTHAPFPRTELLPSACRSYYTIIPDLLTVNLNDTTVPRVIQMCLWLHAYAVRCVCVCICYAVVESVVYLSAMGARTSIYIYIHIVYHPKLPHARMPTIIVVYVCDCVLITSFFSHPPRSSSVSPAHSVAAYLSRTV